MQKTPQRDYWPTTDWQKAEPQAMGLNTTMLAQMQKHIVEHVSGLQGLLIVHKGYLVFEEYYQGFHEKSYNSISSATKSVLSALVGVALKQGLLTSVDEHVLDFFPAYEAKDIDLRKQELKIRHLLTLTAGFSHEFPHEYWLNPVQLALERLMIEQPGKDFYYDSQSVDLLSGIISIATGMSAAAFAHATLFKKLGIWQESNARFVWRDNPKGAHTWHEDALFDEKEGFLWKVDPQGYNPGAFGAHFTAREMAKLGYLYLNKGFWDGEQIISEDYISASTKKQNAGGPPVNTAYGYLWWITQVHNYHAFFASGFGGKLIYVIPALDTVIVTIASTEQALKNRQQTPDINQLISDFVLPSLIGNKHSA